MHVPGHGTNLYKLIQAQAKAMNLTWSTSCGGGAGCVWFQGAKKGLTKGQYLNALVAIAISEATKQNKHEKATDTHDSVLEDDPENFNF